MPKIPPIITRSETTEEFLARGGKIKKIAPQNPDALQPLLEKLHSLAAKAQGLAPKQKRAIKRKARRKAKVAAKKLSPEQAKRNAQAKAALKRIKGKKK